MDRSSEQAEPYPVQNEAMSRLQAARVLWWQNPASSARLEGVGPGGEGEQGAADHAPEHDGVLAAGHPAQGAWRAKDCLPRTRRESK